MLAFQANKQFLRLPVLGLVSIWTLIFLYRYFSQKDHSSSTSVKIAGITAPFRHKTSTGYSIKPVVYIFPQYYPFKQNNEIWFPNFTEWDNVRKAEHNNWGLETIRPHPSIGYYNGLDFATRERQGRLIRENGFYGLAYHHYWMEGIPIMDHILQAMLLDGEPNTPFMLSWANEPWTATWDGLDSSKTLIAQDYGDIGDWRKHFDWLLPFFKHRNYIRSNGKVQFVIYGPNHIESRAPGVKTAMLAAFRKWAEEEGLGGMDIIETRKWENPAGSPPDAINEFQPHTGGLNHERHHLSQRSSRVYHRGAIVCWDNTPRHVSDGRASLWPLCHPNSWKYHIVRSMKTIKEDPNPKGIENFLFINALNEWGEGSSLEPSVQFGNGYAEAMKEAVRISEEQHQWLSDDVSVALAREEETGANVNHKVAPPDVCVLVYASLEYGWDKRYTLKDMIRSLQDQNNPNWRAVVFAIDGLSIPPLLTPTMDSRAKIITIPKELNATRAGQAFDWIINNLTDADPLCWSAKYMLATNAGNAYAPTAFDAAAKGKDDFVALNVESRWTVRDADPALGSGDLCTRLENPELKLHRPSAPSATEFDLAGTLVSLPKFYSTIASGSKDLKLASYPESTEPPFHQEGGVLAESLVNTHGWTWAAPSSLERHVLSNPSYTGCKVAGYIWIDAMNFTETGCFASEDLGREYGGWPAIDLKFYRHHGWCTKRKIM